MLQTPPAASPTWLMRPLQPGVLGLAGRAKQVHYPPTIYPRYARQGTLAFYSHFVLGEGY